MIQNYMPNIANQERAEWTSRKGEEVAKIGDFWKQEERVKRQNYQKYGRLFVTTLWERYRCVVGLITDCSSVARYGDVFVVAAVVCCPWTMLTRHNRCFVAFTDDVVQPDLASPRSVLRAQSHSVTSNSDRMTGSVAVYPKMIRNTIRYEMLY